MQTPGPLPGGAALKGKEGSQDESSTRHVQATEQDFCLALGQEMGSLLAKSVCAPNLWVQLPHTNVLLLFSQQGHSPRNGSAWWKITVILAFHSLWSGGKEKHGRMETTQPAHHL